MTYIGITLRFLNDVGLDMPLDAGAAGAKIPPSALASKNVRFTLEGQGVEVKFRCKCICSFEVILCNANQ